MKSNKNYKILVTGGAGMIGSNLVKKLVRRGFEVFVADNLWRGKKEYLLDDKQNMVIPDKNFFSRTNITIQLNYSLRISYIFFGLNFGF